jgi:hypothetical protein
MRRAFQTEELAQTALIKRIRAKTRRVTGLNVLYIPFREATPLEAHGSGFFDIQGTRQIDIEIHLREGCQRHRLCLVPCICERWRSLAIEKEIMKLVSLTGLLIAGALLLPAQVLAGRISAECRAKALLFKHVAIIRDAGVSQDDAIHTLMRDAPADDKTTMLVVVATVVGCLLRKGCQPQPRLFTSVSDLFSNDWVGFS